MSEEFVFRRTRKIYTWFYVASLLMIASYIYFRTQGFGIKTPVVVACSAFIVLGIKITETKRLHNLYGFNSRYIYHKRGILRRRVKKVFLPRVSDIILERTLMNRLFNYGDVKIHHFGGSGLIHIKNINNPHGFVEELQEMIHKHVN